MQIILSLAIATLATAALASTVAQFGGRFASSCVLCCPSREPPSTVQPTVLAGKGDRGGGLDSVPVGKGTKGLVSHLGDDADAGGVCVERL
ncbi:hypothetical protein BDK51DRAFT_50353 [Blyttiomyces helicus]|uniref:Uncharacterized protein n=1 Tax=Blyttiomyces helicus TaxID=388810 RepID=A0A4P9VWH9_9FUNG|nr:hypothetical protein BDK51DRAFT_50353 [Blyttiomyces helicus]|eukprot:RKO83033.1 hypothetical protein BDK51DRAFT_50353 [Blyttiomyces helicus]